jgi:DNA-binding transcriptional ArsR family regulator
MPIWE